MFGEMSFLEPGSLASASVVAATDVEICILDFQYPSNQQFILYLFTIVFHWFKKKLFFDLEKVYHSIIECI